MGLQGAGYEAGSKFGISVASITVGCFDLTINKMEVERAELNSLFCLISL